MTDPKELKWRRELSALAYWVMIHAIESDPQSARAKSATAQWIKYCELELRAAEACAPAGK